VKDEMPHALTQLLQKFTCIDIPNKDVRPNILAHWDQWLSANSTIEEKGDCYCHQQMYSFNLLILNMKIACQVEPK
jgi:hypothetical protein